MSKSIILRCGSEVLVSDQDFESLAGFTWHIGKDGYARRNTCDSNGKCSQMYMHKQIMSPAVGLQVDHINQEKQDNRRENLRLCTEAQNHQNVRLTARNRSGKKGVGWCKRTGKWRSSIRFNGMQKWIGYFIDIEEAAHAYNKAAVELHGDFAVLNPVGQSQSGERTC